MDHNDPTLDTYCQLFIAATCTEWNRQSLELFEETVSDACETYSGQEIGMMLWVVITLLRQRIPPFENLVALGFNPHTFYDLIGAMIDAGKTPGEAVH